MIRAVALAVLAAGCVAAPDKPPPHGVARSWHERKDPVVPGQRVPDAAGTPWLAYDSRRERVILHDGDHDATWELDPAAGWSLVCDGCIGHTLEGPALVDDALGGRLLLYGGDESDSGPWELHGDTWSPVATTGTPPPERVDTQMVFDPDLGTIWLVGGYYGGDPQFDVWLLTGNAWTSAPAHMPSFITSSPGLDAAYDPERHRLVVVENGNFVADDMMQYTTVDGWTSLCDPCTGKDRSASSIVHLPEYDQTFLLGGCDSTDVASCPFSQIKGTQILVGDHFETYDPELPPARMKWGVAYDPKRDVVVLYGGHRDPEDHDPDCDSTGQCTGTWELSRD